MRRVFCLIAFAAILTLLLSVPSAEAHTLSVRDAANSAWLAAHDWAEEHERYNETLVDVTFKRSQCFRESRHRFFYEWGSAEYVSDDGESARRCLINVTVRYRSRRSSEILTRIGDTSCGPWFV
jgi:hypothetical protein